MKAQGYTKETIHSLGMQERNFPHFEVGDAIAVSLWIREGDKERMQVFEGDVIAMHKKGAASTFTVRKIGANSVAVERILPFQSPLIASIKLMRKGDVRRAKLYYMRDRIGKAARVKEKIVTRGQREQMQAAHENEQEQTQVETVDAQNIQQDKSNSDK